MACPMQHHEPEPYTAGETEPDLVGLCRYDLAAPEHHHAAHDLLAQIMATPHTIALHTPEGELQPWVLSEAHVRDMLEHGKGEALLRLCLAWDPSGCPSCGRDIDKLGGNPECQSCAAEPAGEEA